MAFVQRKINAKITLGTGDFGSGAAGPNNTVVAEGLRVSAQIAKSGAPSADTAEIRIWGLTRDVMNRATDLGKPLARARTNVIQIAAGDAVSGMATVFSGTILAGYADFSDPPNACLAISAMSNAVDAAKPVRPLSFPGGADVVTVMAQVASAMGKSLINWGVSGIQLASPYYPGTAIDQVKAIAAAAGINYATSDGEPLEIWPMNGTRGGAIPEVSPTTGLVGYPQYCDVGCIIKTLYQPGFNIGGQFNLDTSITNAKGLWSVYALSYDLESETPGGEWFAHITAYRLVAAGGGA